MKFCSMVNLELLLVMKILKSHQKSIKVMQIDLCLETNGSLDGPH